MTLVSAIETYVRLKQSLGAVFSVDARILAAFARAVGDVSVSMITPEMHGVSDRAGSRRVSRYRRARWSLPLLLTASAPRRNCLSRLNTRPARTPVNASTPPSRATPHDSGPVWVANPSPYESFIHYTSPV